MLPSMRIVAAALAVAACTAADPRTQPESVLAPERAACTFGPGATAAKTIGTEYPIGKDIPIDHVIVVMQENRSFDNYFGRLVATGAYQPGEVDVPPADWALPDGSGGTVAPHPDTDHCFGVNHGWNDMHDDWDGGKNDHFVTNNNPNGQRSMGYEDDTVIPFYYALAKTFAIGDRYFASVMTSTWPNRLFLMAATSFGIGDNSFVATDTAATPVTQIFGELDAAGRTWKDYTDGPHMVQFFEHYGFLSKTLTHLADVKCDLMTDIANDTLPDVAFVMGNETSETSDEGPSALPGIGGLLVEQIIRALWASPAWAHTAVFIVYDENGGMTDHVPPADACAPDGLAPHLGDGTPLAGDFKHTGFRVPMIVVSPYAKPHYVSHTVYDHSAIARFIETRFDLPAMTGRDANAMPPLDMFDFAHPAFLTPPTIDAHTTVDPAVLTACNQSLAPVGCN
jgi:phospholipase C